MKIKKNTLFYGDNLDILRYYIEDESIDLIYLDPPFKKQKKYNILYQEPNGSPSEAQTLAYADTWYWDDSCEKLYKEIVENSPPKLAETMKGLRQFLREGDMMAYLVNMAIRLKELRRALKPTGSIYLHCDPTASHYLKVMIDSIFGEENFRNEIIWHYRRWTGKAKKFQQLHDIIFFYTKGDKYTFNVLFTDYTKGSKERKMGGVLHRFKNGKEYLVSKRSLNEKGVRENDVWQIPFVAPSAKERLGYPTQKPEALLEKIVKASSDKGDWVLDPFCGCGTTIAIAHGLDRKWIGIDITYLAIDLMKSRLYDSFGELDYEVIGEPTDLHGAKRLAEEDKYQFQYWALGLVNARPLGHTQEGRKGADKGIDGIKYIAEGKERVTKIIVQVKGGHIEPSQIRDLKGTIERENAQIGAFITLKKPTKDMKKEAASAGFYYSDRWNKDYSKIQILTIKDILKKGKTLQHPPTEVTFKKAMRKSPEAKNQKLL